jgi:hypothetical protein
MVLAKYAAEPDQRVLIQLAGRLILAEAPQIDAEVARREQGLKVVLAEHAAEPGQRVLIQLPSLAVAANCLQDNG